MILLCFQLIQTFSHMTWNIHFSVTCFCFRSLHHDNCGVIPLLRRKNRDNIFPVHEIQCLNTYTLNNLVDDNITTVCLYCLIGYIHAVPCQSKYLANTKCSCERQMKCCLKPFLITCFYCLHQHLCCPYFTFFLITFRKSCIYRRIFFHDSPFHCLTKTASENLMYFKDCVWRNISLAFFVVCAINRWHIAQRSIEFLHKMIIHGTYVCFSDNR